MKLSARYQCHHNVVGAGAVLLLLLSPGGVAMAQPSIDPWKDTVGKAMVEARHGECSACSVGVVVLGGRFNSTIRDG